MRHRLLPALSLLLLLTGCAGYHIGPVKPFYMREVKTIAVPTFKNDTLNPRIETLITDTVIKQIQQDGTYRIVPSDTADAILEGTVTDLQRRSARSVRGNVLATSEFHITLSLQYKIVKRDTGAVMHERTVRGSTSFFVGGDLQQDERQAIPLAAGEAAEQLVSEISEGW